MTVLVDTHKIYSILTNAGFEEKKANAIVEVISHSTDKFITDENNELATKGDIERIVREMERLNAATKAEIIRVDTQVKMIKWMIGGGIVLLLLEKILAG